MKEVCVCVDDDSLLVGGSAMLFLQDQQSVFVTTAGERVCEERLTVLHRKIWLTKCHIVSSFGDHIDIPKGGRVARFLLLRLFCPVKLAFTLLEPMLFPC